MATHLTFKAAIDWEIGEIKKIYLGMWLRLISALLFAAALSLFLYRLEDPFNLAVLQKVFYLHHLTACLGIDEALAFNFTTPNFYFKRKVSVHSPTTPLFSFLPNRNNMFQISCYITYIIHLSHCILIKTPLDQFLKINDLLQSLSLFFILSVFDIGLFLSTRPGDILKFVILLGIPIGSSFRVDAIQSMMYLLGALYVWSGISKLHSGFWCYIFQYLFLLPSPIGYPLRRWFLNEDDGWTPSVWSKVFGFQGAVVEIIGGVLLLRETTMFYGCLLMTQIHAFILLFGIGPYRWNIIFVQMMWTLYFNLKVEVEKNGNITLSTFHRLYIAVFAVIIPIIGYFNPYILGRYLGGYRMASFHFTGNETMIGLFIKKDLIRKNEEKSVLINFLKEELKGNEVDNRYDYIFNCDGANVFEMAKDECVRDESYLFVTLFKLSINAGILNTKFDDSLVPISQRYIDEVKEVLNAKKEELKVITYWSNPYWNCGERKATVTSIDIEGC